MSYPKSVALFKPWAAAMVQGATVDKPNYGKTLQMKQRMKRRRRKRKKRNNGSKD